MLFQDTGINSNNRRSKSMTILSFIRSKRSSNQLNDAGGVSSTSLRRNASWGSHKVLLSPSGRNSKSESFTKSNHNERFVTGVMLKRLSSRNSFLLRRHDNSERSFHSDSQSQSFHDLMSQSESARSFRRRDSGDSSVFDLDEVEQRRKNNEDRTKALMSQLDQTHDIHRKLQGHCLP